ncbi:MAG: type II toxin-antitoxin system RelE/ParE family toxin [Nitrosospira sp.]
MAEYRLTPAAEQDLESIWVYTRQQWGMAQADQYIEILIEIFTKLANSPDIASVCDHIRSGYRRYGVARHILYFRTTDYGIVIVRILHDRMDASRHV